MANTGPKPTPGKLQLPPGMNTPLPPPNLAASMGGACQAALNATIDKAHLCFIIPPPSERPHSSWRAIIYTKNTPEKVFHKNRTYPTEIEPDPEIMKRELCDPDHIPAFVVQLTDKDQFVYIEGDVCEVLGVEIHAADGINDPYLKGRGQQNIAPPSSALIIPGQNKPSGGIVANAGMATGNEDMTDIWVIDITFKTHEVKNQTIVDKVKEVAWSHGWPS